MPSGVDADVIVVGAGILGTSVAYHLLEKGVGNVTLIDAADPGTATSGAGAGFVALWAAGYNSYFTEDDLALEQYGIDFYSKLPPRGALIDHRRGGNIFLAATGPGWDNLVAPMAEHPLAPVGTRTLAADEVSKMCGDALASEAVVGGVLHPVGTQMSAGRANRALAAAITAMGGKLLTRTRVRGLLSSGDRILGVRTHRGDLRARQVVLALGAWTNDLLADVGARVPLARIVATRAITRASGVSNAMPTVNVPEWNNLWLREHRGGFTYGSWDGYAPAFELGAEQGDPGQPRCEELVNRLETSLSQRLKRLIPVHDTSIAWWLQGMPCMTPDRRFIAGPVPTVEGLHVFAGDNEAGVTHGPGLGRMLADLIMTGSSEVVDSAIYRPDRFKRDEFPTDQSVWNALPARQWATNLGRL